MRPRTKVLIVDDDPAILLIAEARLQAAGYEVSTRNRALGTSAAAVLTKPDIVLLDVNMPGLPGDELAEMLGNNGVAVILYSGEDETVLRKHVRSTRALGYIRKSGNGDDFLRDFQRLSARLPSLDSAAGREAP